MLILNLTPCIFRSRLRGLRGLRSRISDAFSRWERFFSPANEKSTTPHLIRIKLLAGESPEIFTIIPQRRWYASAWLALNGFPVTAAPTTALSSRQFSSTQLRLISYEDTLIGKVGTILIRQRDPLSLLSVTSAPTDD